MTKRSIAAPAVLAIALAVLAALPAHALGVGDAAPDFDLPSVREGGENTKLSALRGKWVLIDFWATWCGPCRGAMENVLAPLWKEIGEKSDAWTMVSVGVDWSEDTAAQQRAYADEKGYGWLFVHDAGSKTAETYQVEGIPTLVVVDPEGVIRSLGHDDSGIGALYEAVVGGGSALDRAVAFEGDAATGNVERFLPAAFKFVPTAETAGWTALETKGELDTILRVHVIEGENERLVTENDDMSEDETLSLARFHAEPGCTYLIRVSGYEGETGAVVVSRTLLAAGALADRAEDAAAFAGGDEEIEIAEGRDRLLRWTASEDGEVTIGAKGATEETDTMIVVLDAEGAVVASNDDAGDETLDPEVTFEAKAGATYYVQVLAYADVGARCTLVVD